jgi:predicted ATPase
MRELPRGTVTLVFTDIEGSTRLLHELGDAYGDVLAEHRRVLRDAFGRHRGVEVDTQGDAFFYAFERAGDAVSAAEDARRALEPGRVKVRVGIHTGEPTFTDEGYVGVDVHRAARIMSAGHGGQVLVSEATRKLLDARFELRDLGEHRLKDLDAPERLFQLGFGAFPPLKTLNNSNVPVQPEPLLGRKRELSDLLRLIRTERARIVTLTGPGGIGKTRLALELGAELIDDFAHGVWFVDLSPLREPGLVEGAIGEALGARGDVADHVGNRMLALVLDNFEQVVPAATSIARLLSVCSELVVVVTSREPLRIAGEREYPLRPLAEAPAIELFRQRAAASAPDFEASYAEIAELCVRLDSLPLAIELAAARAKTLTVQELRGRLERRLPLLSKGRRDAPERQRTLRATIEWSYELLTPEEQNAFARLAVFAGGSTLAVAEAICRVDVDTLESLVDKSLVRHRDGRYTMLETIREYARERLDELSESEQVSRRHAAWIVELGRSANMTAESEGEQRHAAVNAERENILAALDWTHSRHETALEARILFALENWWVTSGPTRDGLRRALALIDTADDLPPRSRAELLRVAGNNATIVGDEARGRELYESSLAEYRKLGDDRGVATMVARLAFSAYRSGELERAKELAAEVARLLPQVSLPRLEVQALMLEGQIAFSEGEHERALELYDEVATTAERLGFVWWQSSAIETAARRLYDLGRVGHAERKSREALELSRRMGDWEDAAYGLAMLAGCAAHLGQPERAGRLWGVVEARHEQAPLEVWAMLQERFEARVMVAAGADFEAGRAAGRRQALEDAVEEELAAIRL